MVRVFFVKGKVVSRPLYGNGSLLVSVSHVSEVAEAL